MKSGKPTSDPQLTPRDGKILRHVATFGLTTFATLRQVFFAGQEVDAVKSTLRRLCGSGPAGRYLKAEKLDGQRVYYRLARHGAKALGMSYKRARAFGRQALYQRLAILWFIHDAQHSGRRFIDYRQLAVEFGIQVDPIPRHVCYLEPDPAGPRLGIVMADHSAEASRLVRKAAVVLGSFLRRGWFDDLIRDRAFVLTIVTMSEGKKAALESLFPIAVRSTLKKQLARLEANVGDGQHIALKVVVVEELANLLPGMEADSP